MLRSTESPAGGRRILPTAPGYTPAVTERVRSLVATLLAAAVAALPLAGAAGCSSSEPRALFQIGSEDYPAAFDAAKDALRDHQFELERIDARGGVITSQALESAGLATPWIDHASTPRRAVEGLLNDEHRIARVVFAPPRDTPGAETLAFDLRGYEGPVDGRVEVLVERTSRPGWRMDATSVRLGSTGRNVAAEQRGEVAGRSPVGFDTALAGRIARAIRRAIGESIPPQVW